MRKATIGSVAFFAVAAGALFGAAGAEPQGTLRLSADADRYAGPTPFRVRFSTTSSDAKGAVRYLWCFDDGTDSHVQKPTHSFRRAGYYTVVIRAQDESGQHGRQSLLLGVWGPKQ
jgi:hypothetical protein